jgi:hypothetical protein
MLGELRGHGSNEQDMRRLFHDQAGSRNRIHDPFNRRDGTGAQSTALHDGCVHPSHSVQLEMRSRAGIEEPTALQNTNRVFHGNQCRATSIQKVIADLQGGT